MNIKTTFSIIVVTALLVLAGFMLKKDANTIPIDTRKDDLIRVNTPTPNDVITSPLVVRGQARGNWYFEASFPVRVIDANGKQLGIGIAQAQGEWMTTEFVPFSATISFSAPTTETGTVVFQKDNPSDMRQFDDELRVPIRFGQVVSKTRDIKLYFYNSQNDLDSSGNVLCSAKGLVSVNRSIPFTNTPIQDAVKELLKGPTELEKLTIPNPSFPLPGLELKSASLVNGALTLTIADPQNKTGGGSCSVNIYTAQIEATAKQFGGVFEVRYNPESLFQP